VGIKDFIKKKGFKATLLKIPTRRKTFEIEHEMRVEFERHRVVRTLRNVENYLLDIRTRKEINVVILDSLTNEVRAMIKELLAFKS
jgi:hypothetical protein